MRGGWAVLLVVRVGGEAYCTCDGQDRGCSLVAGPYRGLTGLFGMQAGYISRSPAMMLRGKKDN
jgi:hypothetical protein